MSAGVRLATARDPSRGFTCRSMRLLSTAQRAGLYPALSGFQVFVAKVGNGLGFARLLSCRRGVVAGGNRRQLDGVLAGLVWGELVPLAAM